MKSFFALSALALLAAANAGYCPNGYTGFLYAEDCTKFYFCNSGYDNILVCPPPLYFDGELCDHPERVSGCENGRRSGGLPVDPAQPKPQPEPQPQPDPEVKPEPQPQPEPEPQPQPQPEPDQPSKPEPQPEPQPEEPSQPAPQPGDGNVSCPNAPFYYVAVPTNSNLFYVCKNGQLSGTSNCSPDLVFNQGLQACVR